MPLINPEWKAIAQAQKTRHFNLCHRCKKKFRGRDQCPRCGSRSFRKVSKIKAKEVKK